MQPQIFTPNFYQSYEDKWRWLRATLREMTPQQEREVSEKQWWGLFHDLQGYYVSPPMRALLELPIARRHINAQGQKGTALAGLLTWSQMSEQDQELADCMLRAGALVADKTVWEALVMANDDALLWMHKNGIDIGVGSPQKNLQAYLKAANDLFREPSSTVVSILQAKAIKLELEEQLPLSEKATEFNKNIGNHRQPKL